MRRSGLRKKFYVVVYERKNGLEITVVLRITLGVVGATSGAFQSVFCKEDFPARKSVGFERVSHYSLSRRYCSEGFTSD